MTDSWEPAGRTNILSMGAGVQTTAILLKWGHKYDHVIFADTGDEKPETYEYMEKYQKPFCKENDIDWITVRRTDRYPSLLEHCEGQRVIPTRIMRWCTNDYKVTPIKRKVKELGAKAKSPFNIHIGISMDESHRIPADAFIDNPRYYHKVYPLIDHKLTRQNCREIITAHGWPVPPKSGCWYCPFAGRKELLAVQGTDPARYARMVAMERNNRQFPKMTLSGTKPLPMSHQLTEFADDVEEAGATCDSGYCMEDGL